MTATVVVSLHDVAPASLEASQRWLSLVERHDMVASLLVIPGMWRDRSLATSPDCVRWLHQATERGHEVVLHGWEHRQLPDSTASRARRLHSQVRARGCAEFATLQPDAAQHLLELGLGALAHQGFHPHGFVPPGWMAQRSTDDVLRDLGFAYTTSQWEVRDLQQHTVHRIPSTSQRPGSRFTNIAAKAMLMASKQFAARQRHLRIALHPDDLLHPTLESITDGMLSAVATAGHQSLTYETMLKSVSPIGAGTAR
jgi:hypothetical protein